MTERRATQSSGLGPNQLVWDLGVDNIYDDDEVRERIKLVEKKFHLVMILEQFEVREQLLYNTVRFTNNFQESLILMKRLLCWDFEDITNLKLNARKQSVVIF